MLKNCITLFLLFISMFVSVFSYSSELENNVWDKINNASVVIDVRTPAEFYQGHLDEAINIPLSEFSKGVLQYDKESAIVVYCRSGNRSGQAYKIMESIGYKNIYNAGGLQNILNAKK